MTHDWVYLDYAATTPVDRVVAEVMRRYLTSLYDWTGLSRKFYTSKIWELAAIAFFALLVIAIGLGAVITTTGISG